MSSPAIVQSGAAKQSAVAHAKQSGANKNAQTEVNFLGSISETLQGQLGAAGIVSRNKIKDLDIGTKERNIDEWGWPAEEEIVQAFIKKIEKALSLWEA